MKRFLHAYGADMEFGQIQLNYLDCKFQDAQAKVELLREFGIPVWVMEPLRGGRLFTLSKDCLLYTSFLISFYITRGKLNAIWATKRQKLLLF